MGIHEELSSITCFYFLEKKEDCCICVSVCVSEIIFPNYLKMNLGNFKCQLMVNAFKK